MTAYFDLCRRGNRPYHFYVDIPPILYLDESTNRGVICFIFFSEIVRISGSTSNLQCTFTYFFLVSPEVVDAVNGNIARNVSDVFVELAAYYGLNRTVKRLKVFPSISRVKAEASALKLAPSTSNNFLYIDSSLYVVVHLSQSGRG